MKLKDRIIELRKTGLLVMDIAEKACCTEKYVQRCLSSMPRRYRYRGDLLGHSPCDTGTLTIELEERFR